MYSYINHLTARILPAWIHDRFIGRWNQSGLKRYTANMLWGLASRVTSIAVSFIVAVYLIRYLGPENYGQLGYAVSFTGLFAIIGGLGLDSVLYRDLIKYPHKRNAYLGTAFVIRLLAGAVAGLLTIAGAFLFSHDDVSRLIILILSGTFIFQAFNVAGYEFQANVAQKYTALASLIVLFILNLMKVAVIIIGQGILYIGIILLFEAILTAAAMIYLRSKYYGSLFDWKFDPIVAKSLLRDSWPFIFIAAFTTVYTRIDQVMLKHMMDSSAVGLYDAAVRIAEAWIFVPAMVTASLFPAIINARTTNLVEYKKRLLLLASMMVILGIVVATPLSLYAKPLMMILYGTSFASASSAFAIYIWAGVWTAVGIVMQYFLLAENRRFLIFATSCGTAIINIILNLILIPIYGIAGAAIATLISYVVLAMPLLLVLRLKI